MRHSGGVPRATAPLGTWRELRALSGLVSVDFAANDFQVDEGCMASVCSTWKMTPQSKLTYLSQLQEGSM